jgi:hypothetical protein
VSERTREYREAVKAVRAILDQYDPEGLRAIGAPDDEYDPEAHDLVRFVLGTTTPTPETVQATWHRWFATELRPDLAEAINGDLQRLRAAIPEP